MATSSEHQPLLDLIGREVEQAVYHPPYWVLDGIKHELSQSVAAAVAEVFAESLKKAIVKAASQSVAQAVRDGVVRGLLPLAEEVASLREALERQQDEDDWWKHGSDEPEEGPPQQ